MRVTGGVPLWVVCVSPCRCCVFVSVVHPVAILSAVFCFICSLLIFVSGASGGGPRRHSLHEVGLLQTSAQIVSTQSLPSEMGARFRFLGKPVVAPCRLAGSAPHNSGGRRVKSWPDDTHNTLQSFGLVTSVINRFRIHS